jgi:2-phospho-L-lactate/phosphoenolpyruvate guanylyltransferase
MKIAAVIPMKSLHSAKSRLSNILTAKQRKNLAMYLLDATIKELKKSDFISEIVIVSSDEAVKHYSCLNNIKFIKDWDEGVNKAVMLADKYCINNDINANIVIPPDLPFVSAKEIDKICIISNKYHKCIIICPSKRLDGTNILFRKPPGVIKTHYDNNSYMNHLKEASKIKIPIESLDIVKLMFDLDTEDDLLELFPLQNWNSVLESNDLK